MAKSKLPAPASVQPDRRWPAMVAVMAVAAMHVFLPEDLSVGPGWSLVAMVAVLSAAAIVTRRTGRHDMNQIAGYSILAVVTAALVYSLAGLVAALISHKGTPAELLYSALILWSTNVVLFAGWYWRLDAGGPKARSERHFHEQGAFLFPQMTLGAESRRTLGIERWSPEFMDYVFLAFNTSTAFSPTDVPVLSRWAKALMMVQSSISLVTLAILAARAVNII